MGDNVLTTKNKESLLPLSRIFDSSASRILDFLIANRDFDYSESDIRNLSGISARTVQRILPNLLLENIVIRTRKSGKAFMYKANFDSTRLKALCEYAESTAKEMLQQKRPED